MNTLFLNNDSLRDTFPTKDVLSAFKQHAEKPTTIRQGMTVEEIAEVVSEKVMAVIKEQFQETKEQFQKEQFQTKETKK